MKFWTVQSRAVAASVSKFGEFQPVFKQSSYVRRNPDLAPLYNTLLEAFNRIHNIQLPGLAFCFTGADDENNVKEIATYEEFKALIQSKKDVIGPLWENIAEGEAVVMEVESFETFNPLYIDINDFQCIMPPILVMPPYQESDIEGIIKSLSFGIYRKSPMPSGIIQAHIPHFKKVCVRDIYPTFDLD